MSRHYRHYADGHYLYFITSTIAGWLPLFLSHRYFTILTDAFACCRENKGLLRHAYVLMPAHFHIIASSQPMAALPGLIRDFKRYTSREITCCLEEDGSHLLLQPFIQAAAKAGRNNDYAVWQPGYHPVAVFTERFFRQKLDYLHDNPVRKGYVHSPENWLYSSAGDYLAGTAGVVAIDPLER